MLAATVCAIALFAVLQRDRCRDALQKIAEGTYGISDRSGAPIPKARLVATPEAVVTVEEAAEESRARYTLAT